MGWIYECYNCDQHTWGLPAKEEHEKQLKHKMWGGSLHWRPVDGLCFQWERGVVTDEDKELYKEYIKELNVLVKHKHHFHLYFATPDGWIMYRDSKYERPELQEVISHRKPKPPSKRRGCPKCGKSENIRFIKKGTLICKACDYTFGKGEKL